MKRWIMIAISIALVLYSIQYLPENIKPAVTAGAGNGNNTNIASVNELHNLIDYLFYKINSSNPVVTNIPHATLLDTDSENTTLYSPESKYNSVTLSDDVFVDSFIVTKILDTTDGQLRVVDVGSTSTLMNRNLTLYMCNDISYYDSKTSLKINYKDFNNIKNSYETTLVLDFQMYVDNSNILIKFNSFDLVADDTNIDLSGYIGKWLSVTQEFAFELLEGLDELNRDTLAYIQEYINDGMKDFKKVDKKYTLKTKTVVDGDTFVTIDLNNSENPFIGFNINANEPSNQINMSESITFSNIDNTVINIDFRDVYYMTTEEMLEIFGGE